MDKDTLDTEVKSASRHISHNLIYGLPHRYVCSILDEMRAQVKCLNIFTYFKSKHILLSQLEEVQTLVNRMEASIGYKNDIEELHAERKELQREVSALKSTIKQ